MRIILLGPTASGKTELSLQIAEELEIPIISVDSRQCYKHLDIGTAKPSEKELQRVEHYNISNLELDEPDSVQAFSERAEVWEKEILSSSDHSFFVGGSTLHLQSLIRPIEDIPSANEENIAQIESQIDKEGIEPVYNKLNSVDPEYVKTMDGMNRQRIIRALDVWMQTGKPFSSFHSNEEFELPENTLVFGLQRDRQNLYDRINQRVDNMIDEGLAEETQKVLEMGYSKDLQPLNAVGYREIIAVLEGKMELDKAVEKIKTQTRRYAKRQLTWFKRWDFIEWLPADEKKPEELKEILLSHLAAKQ
ncbi:MAG TPA: tRNA (adenosine(37)-N6)-dimethylallyltransferase MiaA [Planctomycetaceae bacterium]|nr:tRNA (adenosine(37)-N6)-dimethylallyltransferase MiaA [Balneola sp.]HAH43358.1 tRNA (adenosine(37)-N6)-dimethylallyltransferase MiaA [Planctomycetaceae bacterium]MAO77384.1 tRNA (adenosine(37)-N6)-dimethylallyltransferase MiaA [Balneola sp.]MBF65342.1 tRNA (adenosine(37)-N6)-dimethylallyltransferase MiaA [Balneola sp.]HAW78798.1 tRNA (adenosine(37)-N6)-dimethylallyltransferase MiaA [Balneola sp.]